jgi:hypothetical protein
LGTERASAWVCLVSLLSVSGCSGLSDEPLSFGGYGNTLAPHDRPPYFVVDVCAKGNPVSVTFNSVEAIEVAGTTEPISFRVAWPDSGPFERVISSNRRVPAAYEPVNGATGEVWACGKAANRYGALAVVFPPTDREPVSVEGLRVSYEVSGKAYTQVVEVSLTQCSRGTWPAGLKGKCVPRSATR